GGEARGTHAQPVVGALAKPPGPDRGLEIFAGRGDHPHVHHLSACGAEPSHGALFDRLEDLGLERLGQEADLVEEKRAAIGHVQQTWLGVEGIGEGASLVAEQLGLEHGLGNGGAVQIHERPARPRAGPGDGRRHQPPARPPLPEQQDGRQASCAFQRPGEKPADLLAQGHDPRTRSHESIQESHGTDPTTTVQEYATRCRTPSNAVEARRLDGFVPSFDSHRRARNPAIPRGRRGGIPAAPEPSRAATERRRARKPRSRPGGTRRMATMKRKPEDQKSSTREAQPASFDQSFESLETRLMPAVTATFLPSSGVLSVSGDNQDNTIEISRNAAGALLVNGGAVAITGGTPTVANTALVQAFGQGGNDTITMNEAV